MAAQAKPSVLCDSVPTAALPAGSVISACADEADSAGNGNGAEPVPAAQRQDLCGSSGAAHLKAGDLPAGPNGAAAASGLAIAAQDAVVCTAGAQNIFSSPAASALLPVGSALPLGLYVHVPFCSSTCDFCAFYQEKPRRDQIDLYLKAVEEELRAVRREILLGLPWVWQGEGILPASPAMAGGASLGGNAPFLAGSVPRSGGGGDASGIGLPLQSADKVSQRLSGSGNFSGAGGVAVPFVSGFTVFFGGGTPGLLAAKDLEKLCTLVREALGGLGPILEWSIELAPSTVKADKVQVLLEQGVTRFSLGVQSFSERLLDALGRQHNPKQIFAAYETLRAGGAANVNCDLMFALPGQSREDWLADLEQMRALDPEHISTYCLTFEEDTALWVKLSQGRCKLDPENEAALYRETWRWLDAAGYRQYEVSNFAKEGFRSRHNLATWQMSRWRGVGPSAASQWGGWRFQNVANLGEWANTALAQEGLLLPPVAGYAASPAGGCGSGENATGSRESGESTLHGSLRFDDGKVTGSREGGGTSQSHRSGHGGATGNLVAGGKIVGEDDFSGKTPGEAAASGGVLHIGKKASGTAGGAVWPPAGSEQHVALDNNLLAADALIFGLRRRDGVNRSEWLRRFGLGDAGGAPAGGGTVLPAITDRQRLAAGTPPAAADGRAHPAFIETADGTADYDKAHPTAAVSANGTSLKAIALARVEALFARLTKEGLLDAGCADCWRLTDDGLLVADAVGGEVMLCFEAD